MTADAAPRVDGQTPVDVVYTWVDGEDVDYQALCRRYADNPENLNPERYRDIYSLLKYSLRSLDRYVPWVRDIYLFTCRPQVPAWLNPDHPRIHLVHHDEVGDPEHLPTFSSNVIESYLHRIPGSAAHLLYINDDFLFGRNTEREDFFTADGRIKVFGSLLGEHLPFRIYDGRFNQISLGFIEHAPILIYRPFWAAMQQTRWEQVQRTQQHRFRQPTDVRMDFLYRYYLLSSQRQHVEMVPFFSLLRYHQFHKITNDRTKQRRSLDKLRRKRPKFYCLNDDQRDCPNMEVVAMVQTLLDDWYPDKSPFEK
jgi:stealth protein CR2/Stealth-like protein